MNKTTRCFLARTAAVLFFAMLLPCWGIGNCVWADEVTAEQALKEAQSFVTNLQKTSGGPRRAPGTVPQLTAAGQVSGLYLFNIGSQEGFVVVSNDDGTTPILGFGESGAIDIDCMPSNMRAWLQGYADEIAWLQTQSTQNLRLNVPLRISTRQNVGPLLSTTWNQNAPYNEQTPFYKKNGSNIEYRKDNQSGYSHCATGCVATALAQVMKYHQWPSQSTNIPAYVWKTAGITLDGLSAVNFDWGNMLDSYKNSYTTAQANAVSTLMKYCGWAVQMEYGPESSSNTSNLLNAITSYFGYKETAQVALRSLYTYDNWVELIYHEIYENRPVLFAGQSKGGGHEFVCDGYKKESNTDYFHINWGWGGLSDNYFVLSALTPDLQGIGGSTDLSDGFNSSVEAVIGIQEPNDSGTVADVEIRDLGSILVVNSMTTDHSSINLGSSINITLNITNDSDEDYNGGIYVGRIKDNIASPFVGGEFAIPARETLDCTLPYTPDELGTYDLLFFYPIGFTAINTDFNVYASFTVVPAGTPTDLTVSDITGREATLRWTDISGATQWVVAYKAKRDDSFTEVTANTPYVALSNLTPKTEYTAKVRPANNANLWSVETTFTTVEAYPAPQELAATDITHNTAKASWTGNADSYEVRYGKANGNIIATTAEWLQYDDGKVKSLMAITNMEEYTWGVMYPGEQVTGNRLTKVSIMELYSYNTEDITVNIYSGGDNAPGLLLYTQVVTPEAINAFHEVELDEPVAITPGENLWITLTEQGQYTIGYCEINDTDPNSQWIMYNGSWYHLKDLLSGSGIENRCWMIRGYIESDGINYDAVSWIAQDVNCSDSWCELTGLEPNSEHVVQVKGKYQDGGESRWAAVTFATDELLVLSDNGGNNSNTLSGCGDDEYSVQLFGRTLYKDSEWNTICLPFNVVLDGSPLEGATAKTLADATMTGTTVSLTFGEVVDELEAGVPYIIKWTGGEDIKNPTFTNVQITDTEGKTIEKADGCVKFIGYYDAFGITAANDDIYYMTSGNSLKHTGKARTLNACRAYFQFSENVVSTAREFVLDFGEGGTTTAIDNGMIVENAETDRAIYDLQGRKVEQRSGQPGKGIYIREGRKVIVK